MRNKLLLVALPIFVVGCANSIAHVEDTPAEQAEARRFDEVGSVTDGDTIRLRDGTRVRLVQIDTPETQAGPECGGEAAAAALRDKLKPGTRVRLQPEPTSDMVDSYGRWLRYVHVGSLNVNVWMVRQGHAAPYFYDRQEGMYASTMLRDARAARANRLGFWGRCPGAVLEPYRALRTGAGS